MWKQFTCVSAGIAAMFLLLPRAGANKNFVPDWTFQGSSLGACAHARQRQLARRKRRDRGYSQNAGRRLADPGQAASRRAVRIHIPLHRRLPRGRDAPRAIDAGGNARRLRRVTRRREPRGRLRLETGSAGPRDPASAAQSGGRHGSVHCSTARRRTGRPGASRRQRRRTGRRRTRLRTGSTASRLSLHPS